MARNFRVKSSRYCHCHCHSSTAAQHQRLCSRATQCVMRTIILHDSIIVATSMILYRCIWLSLRVFFLFLLQENIFFANLSADSTITPLQDPCWLLVIPHHRCFETGNSDVLKCVPCTFLGSLFDSIATILSPTLTILSFTQRLHNIYHKVRVLSRT